MWVLFAVGLVFNARGLWLRASSSGWPTTSGAVIASRVAFSTDQEGYTYRYPQVTYRYSVSGTTYTATEGSLPGDPDDVVHEHPPGDPVTVHYNPNRPSEAFLATGLAAVGLGAIILPVGGAIVLGYLSVAIFRSFRNWATEV
jgi:hypothetical protein